MSLNSYILAGQQNGSESFIFEVGHTNPVPLPPDVNGANLCSFGDGSTLFLSVLIPHPSPREILGFHQPFQFRIYASKDMPGGLVLMRMTHNPAQIGSMFECPFDAVLQGQQAPGSLNHFFTAKKIAILATLTDTSRPNGKVVAIRLMEMPASMVQRLRELWHGQVGEPDYYDQYRNLAKRKPTRQLWTQAQPF